MSFERRVRVMSFEKRVRVMSFEKRVRDKCERARRVGF